MQADGVQSRPESILRRQNPGRSHRVIQSAGPLDAATRLQLAAQGIEIVSWASSNAWVASIPDGVEPEGLSLYRIPPEAKISRAVNRSRPGGVIVVFHRDVTDGDARAIVNAAGLAVRENPDLLPGHLLVTAAPEAVNRIVSYDEVAYVFPASASVMTGAPVAACPGPITVEGPVAQYIARVSEGWDGAGQGSAELNYAYLQLTDQLSADGQHKTFEKALAEWSRYVQVNFHASEDPYAARTLTILFARGSHGDAYPFDGSGNVLAHTFYPAPLNAESIAGDLHLDNDENWNSVDLFSVALHELGHALGLGHSDSPSSVMYPYYRTYTELQQEDIDAIRSIYAARTADTPTTPTEPTTPTTPTEPTTPNTPTTPTTPSEPTTPSTPTTPTAPSDTTAPSLTITYPFTSNVGTSDSTIGFRGTARDDTGVVAVTWTANDGQSGNAQGTTFWSIPLIKLRVGTTIVKVRAADAAGNVSWRSVTVTRN